MGVDHQPTPQPDVSTRTPVTALGCLHPDEGLHRLSRKRSALSMAGSAASSARS